MSTALEQRTSTFPLDWNDIEDPSGTYLFDPMHFPFPISPLAASSHAPAFATGFTAAAKEFNTPILRVHTIAHNHFRFERHDMAQPASPDEARAMGELAEATLKPELGRMLE